MGENKNTASPAMQRVQTLHAFLLEQGIPAGSFIPRPLWDQLMPQGFGVGASTADNDLRTGERLGLWERRQAIGRVPAGVVLATNK